MSPVIDLGTLNTKMDTKILDWLQFPREGNKQYSKFLTLNIIGALYTDRFFLLSELWHNYWMKNVTSPPI